MPAEFMASEGAIMRLTLVVAEPEGSRGSAAARSPRGAPT